MAKQIAKLLKTDVMADLDLKGIAQILKSRGRNGDKILAHITPKEAALLKKRGGSGTKNPDTGLPEFYEDDGGYDLMQYANTETGGGELGGYASQAAQEAPAPAAANQQYFDPFTQPTPAQQQMNPNTGGASLGLDYTSPAAMQAQKAYYGQPAAGTDVMGNTIPVQPVSGSYGYGAPGVGYGAPGSPTPTSPSLVDKAKNWLTTPNKAGDSPLEKLGIAGIGAIPGILGARKAQQQGEQAKAEKQAIASPYQAQGKQLQEQALRGELTGGGLQAMEAARAQMAQGAEGRGGVGALQNDIALQKLQQTLLANQYQLGMQVSQLGDQIAIGAIDTGLKADQYVNNLTQNYYNQMFGYLGGMPSQQQPIGGR